MLWQNNGIWGLRNDQVCLFPANNPMETAKWKVKNTRLKEVVCSVWIYCRLPRLFPEFDSAWRPCREDCSLPLPCLFNRHCQAILPVPFIPSQCRTLSCFDKRSLREHSFIVLKWFDIEDRVTLLGREADTEAWHFLLVWLSRFLLSLTIYEVRISFIYFGWWSRMFVAINHFPLSGRSVKTWLLSGNHVFVFLSLDMHLTSIIWHLPCLTTCFLRTGFQAFDIFWLCHLPIAEILLPSRQCPFGIEGQPVQLRWKAFLHSTGESKDKMFQWFSLLLPSGLAVFEIFFDIFLEGCKGLRWRVCELVY